jgi:predicted CopG family antitoxin
VRRMKRPGESFSKIINRLLKRKVKLTEVAGSKTITSREWGEVEEAFKNRNKLDDGRRE